MATIKDGKIFFDDSDFGGITIFSINIKAPYQELFKWAYRRHDLQYQFYKPITLFSKNRGKNKSQIDQEFLNDMLRIAKRKCNKTAEKTAYLLYSIVVSLGFLAWYNRKEILNKDDIK